MTKPALHFKEQAAHRIYDQLVHRPLNQLIDKTGKWQPALLTICQLTHVPLSHSPTLEEIVQKTQKHWLRKPGIERHELTAVAYEPPREQLLPLLAKVNVIKAVQAKNTRCAYDIVLLHGAMADNVNKRIQFLIAEYQRGVRFKQVVLLTGDRPLHPEKELEYIQLGLKTEADMLKYLWKTTPGLPDTIKERAHLVNAKGKRIQGKYQRPTTRDTICQWLYEVRWRLKRGSQCLAISHQPFIPFQDFVFYNTLQKRLKQLDLKLETIGAVADPNEPIGVHLDNLARCLYELHLARTSQTLK